MNIEQKWQTFKRHPVRSVKSKCANVVPSLLRHWGLQRLEGTGVLKAIDEFNATRPSEAFGDPPYADLWFPYWNVRQRKPRVILEFGSGISTVCLAQALVDNGSGKLYSVDGDEHWAKSTGLSIPFHLKSVCDVRYSRVDRYPLAGKCAALRFANLPEVIPDFVFLDGPADQAPCKPAVDLLDMESQFPTGFFLVIDERDANTEYLRMNFKRRYRFRRRKLAHQPTFELLD